MLTAFAYPPQHNNCTHKKSRRRGRLNNKVKLCANSPAIQMNCITRNSDEDTQQQKKNSVHFSIFLRIITITHLNAHLSHNTHTQTYARVNFPRGE